MTFDRQDAQRFWNTIGATKEFKDPFSFEKFLPDLEKNSIIVEYGCGYGRILNLLYEKGFTDCIGFDFAPALIEQGKSRFPHLTLKVLARP